MRLIVLGLAVAMTQDLECVLLLQNVLYSMSGSRMCGHVGVRTDITHAHIHTYIHTFTYAHTHLSTHIHTNICAHIYAHIHSTLVSNARGRAERV